MNVNSYEFKLCLKKCLQMPVFEVFRGMMSGMLISVTQCFLTSF